MFCMRSVLFTVVSGMLLSVASVAFAQTDAEIALAKARTAFAAEKYEAARDLLITAAQTEPRDPDIHLLLGKSHYQLGEVEQAMKAWRATLRLAPQQAYAKRMLARLQGEALDAKTRLALAASLLKDRLFTQAAVELAKVRLETKLTDEHRQQLLLLDAELSLSTGKPDAALHRLEELAIRFADQKDQLPTQLLRARAEVAIGGDSLAEGLATLEELSKNETRLGARAKLELVAFRFRQGTAKVEDVLGWIEANADHPAQLRAREVLLSAVQRLLTITTQGSPVTEKSRLSVEEKKALMIAAKIYPALLTSAQADALTQSLVKHFESRYRQSEKTLATASVALGEIGKLGLPPTSQRLLAAAQRSLKNQIATVEYQRIVQQLQQGVDDSASMTRWIGSNPDHPNVVAAQRLLLGFYLAETLQDAPVSKESVVSPNDIKAIELAKTIYEQTERVGDALKITTQFDVHFKKRYVSAGALNAADTAYRKLLEAKLPVGSESLLLRGLVDVQTRQALLQLAADAREQRLKAGPYPVAVKTVLETLARINRVTPSAPSHKQQAELAQQVSALSSYLKWPAQPTAPKPTQQWAIEIALPVIAESNQSDAKQIANATIDAILADLSALSAESVDGLAVAVHAQRLAVLEKSSDAWVAAQLQRVDLLQVQSNKLFQRNISRRQPDANAKLSAPQLALIETLQTLVTAHPSQAATVVSKLQVAMSVPLATKHYDAVQSAYASLKPSLPEQEKFSLDLAQLEMLVAQVITRDSEAKQRGFAIAAKLDPLMEKALLGAYELQRGIDEKDPRTVRARAVLHSVTAYYRGLEMFDVVEAALDVRSEKPIASADKLAQFLKAGLLADLAIREQQRLLKEFRGRESITFTAAFQAAEAAYQKFVTDHPGDPLTVVAVEQLFAIGVGFENQQRAEIAAAVYARIEKFAKPLAELNRVPAGQPAAAERAALASAIAWQQHAARQLQEQLADQPADAGPPEKISDNYARAIEAYRAVVKNYPDGPLAKPALDRTLSIGLEYAGRDAWTVADSVYAGVLAQKLSLRRPERIEFARAICELGKVMPAHARGILTTLVHGNKKPKPGEGSAEMLAMAPMNEILSRLRSNGKLDSLPGGFSDFDLSGRVDVDPARRPAPPSLESPVGSDVGGGKEKGEAGSGPGELPEPSSQPADLGDHREAEERLREAQLLAAVQQQQGQLATQVAQLRDAAIQFSVAQTGNQEKIPVQLTSAVLTEAEIDRQQKALDKAYVMLQALRTRYPETPTAGQARGEILIIVGHWRGMTKWQRAAKLAARFLQDNPTDVQLPTIRREIARDYLAWAAQGVKEKGSKQQLLDEVNRRYEQARQELAGIVRDFPKNAPLRQQAQWDVANSFLAQARVIATLSPTLARGQYVRSANELLQVAREYHDHPRIGEVPQMLWNISNELASRRYLDEAVTVWNALANNYPTEALGQQASLQIAQTYQSQNQPLKAVEAYVELNFARGGNNAEMQLAIYSLATQLKGQKRWVESLHALETFVDSFPQHANAGQALTMIGQIHQANEVWEDAIASYDRVMLEYPSCECVKEARWSIAECTINLSRWRDAIESYEKFAQKYPGDAQAALAVQRIETLKDLARYQRVVDEVGQRKSFDAQYQIGEIVRHKLANKVKAIIEYRKVADKWPTSHLADDALYQVGVIYLDLGETKLAREALLTAANKYPRSPLADDALLMVGQSYEQEAAKFAAVTRDSSVAESNDQAQKSAYSRSQDNRRQLRYRGDEQVAQLKKSGLFDQADELVAKNANLNKQFDYANAQVFANWAEQKAQVLTAAQLADRQDKVNASLREAVAAFHRAASMVTGDKADDALLRMAHIYDTQLKDADAAMETWQEIVKQFSGTSVAEDASWKIARYHEQHSEYQDAIDAYQTFLRNYRGSPKAGEAQAAIAENYEHLGKWVDAMDAYTNYLNNFPKGPLVGKAKEQISWIKTYRL